MPLHVGALMRMLVPPQYFLLTPKLLPDLDYGQDTAIQFVYNGPFMIDNNSLTLSTYT